MVSKLGIIVLATLALASVAMGFSPDEIELMRSKLRQKFPVVKTIEAKELSKKLSSSPHSFILIDTRAKEEFDVSHLIGAILFEPESDALEDIASKYNKENEIVTYCSVGYRSSMIAEELISLGFNNVRSLNGGIFEWANSGYSIYKAKDGLEIVTDSVHPFDKKWGRLLDPKLNAQNKAR